MEGLHPVLMSGACSVEGDTLGFSLDSKSFGPELHRRQCIKQAMWLFLYIRGPFRGCPYN